jgi:putative transposase
LTLLGAAEQRPFYIGIAGECLAIDVIKRHTSEDVLKRLSDLFVRRVEPNCIRSDYGPEFTAKSVCDGLSKVGVKTLFIESDSPW